MLLRLYYNVCTKVFIMCVTFSSQSLGLELLPPSPQKSHNVSSPEMQHLQSHLSLLSLPNDTGTCNVLHQTCMRCRWSANNVLAHSVSTAVWMAITCLLVSIIQQVHQGQHFPLQCSYAVLYTHCNTMTLILQRWHTPHVCIYFIAVSTPEAVHNISRSIQRASRSQKPKHAYPHSSSIPRRIPPATSESGDQQKELGINKSEGINSSTKSNKQKKRTTKTTKTQPLVSTHVSGVKHAKETTPNSKAEGSSRREMGSPHTKTVVREGGDGGDSGGGGEGEGSGREPVHLRTALSSAQSPGAPTQPTNSCFLDTMPAAHDILATQVHVQIML